ncbi:peptidyl-prolyl cis-trans isomerase FKBP15-1 [Tanacetum coccineum]
MYTIVVPALFPYLYLAAAAAAASANKRNLITKPNLKAVLNQAVAVVVPCTGSSEAYIVNNDTPTTKDKNGSLAESLVLHLTPISSMKSAQSGFLNDVDRKEEILFGRMIHRKNEVIVSQSPLGPSYHLQVVLKLCFSRFRCDLTLSSLLEWIIKIGKSEKIRTLEFYGRAPVLSVHPHRLDPTMGENKELLAPGKKECYQSLDTAGVMAGRAQSEGQTTIHVIGWDQGLLGMCAREKCKLKIPFKMGYGGRASPPKIPGGVIALGSSYNVA